MAKWKKAPQPEPEVEAEPEPSMLDHLANFDLAALDIPVAAYALPALIVVMFVLMLVARRRSEPPPARHRDGLTDDR